MRRFAFIALPLVISWTAMLGGDRSNIRGMGMGRTFIAGSRNVDALGINPANLALEDRWPVTFLPFQVGARVSSEFLSYDLYQKYFTGTPDPANPGERIAKTLSADDKNTLLSTFPDFGSFIRSDVEVQLAGLSLQLGIIGDIGFAVTEHVGARFDLSRDYFRFASFGLDSAGSRYDFNGTSVSAWWWREYNISYARRFPITPPFLHDLYVGVGVKLVQGFSVVQTDRYSGYIANVRDPNFTNQYNLSAGFNFVGQRSLADFLLNDSTGKKRADFNPFSPAGKGMGYDIGVSAEVVSGLRVGVSVTDIGKITWDKNIIETSSSASMATTDPFSKATQDSLKDAFKGKERPGKSFETKLPTVLRIGATIQSEEFPFLKFLPGKMLLALDYNQGLNESLGNTTKPRVSAGMEYRVIPLIPLRTGFSVGGNDKPRWAVGFGIDFLVVSLDFATENFGMLFFPKSFNMFSVAMGLRVRL